MFDIPRIIKKLDCKQLIIDHATAQQFLPELEIFTSNGGEWRAYQTHELLFSHLNEWRARLSNGPIAVISGEKQKAYRMILDPSDPEGERTIVQQYLDPERN